MTARSYHLRGTRIQQTGGQTLNNFRRLALALALGSTFGSAHAYVNIVFDYRYDSSGFFTADRRATLEQAAQAFETRVFDDLTAITSTPGGNGVVLELGSVGNSNIGQQITNATIAKNEIRIYVGGTSNGGLNYEEKIPLSATPGGMGLTPTTTDMAYANAAFSRGQTGWPESESGTWGGTLNYSTNVSWYADTDVSTTESFAGQWDLYTVTLKGLVSILGASDNGLDSGWLSLINGVGNFNGAKAKAEYGVRNSRGVLQAVPLESVFSASTRLKSTIQGKLDDGDLQLALLAWSLSTGERRYMTELDYAILDDIGWDVTGFTEMPNTPPVPEPQTWAMLAAGLGLIGLQARKKMRD